MIFLNYYWNFLNEKVNNIHETPPFLSLGFKLKHKKKSYETLNAHAKELPNAFIRELSVMKIVRVFTIKKM